MGKEPLNFVFRSSPHLSGKNLVSRAKGPDEGSNDFRFVFQQSG